MKKNNEIVDGIKHLKKLAAQFRTFYLPKIKVAEKEEKKFREAFIGKITYEKE